MESKREGVKAHSVLRQFLTNGPSIYSLRYSQWKVDRELANHSLSSTASQGTSDIPFPWFLMLGCNSQAQDLRSHGGCPNLLSSNHCHRSQQTH